MSKCYRLCRVGLLAALALGAGVGCWGEQPYGEVEGVVTLGDKPLANAEVVFLPDPEKGNRGRRSTALTDKEGRYRIASDAGRGGAPVGVHRVCVNDLLAGPPGVAPPVMPEGNPKKAGTPDEAADPRGKKGPRFPEAYGDAHKTPLRDIEVKPGAQTINLELKRDLPR